MNIYSQPEQIGSRQSITEYIIENCRLPYRLIIIDVPGFGGIQGVQRDLEIYQDVINVFEDEQKSNENVQINAICLTIKGCVRCTTAEVIYFY